MSKDIAKELNYTQIGETTVSDHPATTEDGAKIYGEYYGSSRNITIYRPNLAGKDADFVQQVIAHEMTHDLMRSFASKALAEQKEFKQARDTGGSTVVDPAKYPAYAIYQKYVQDPKTVSKVYSAASKFTPYSRQIFSHAMFGSNGPNLFGAFNETMAEVGAMKYALKHNLSGAMKVPALLTKAYHEVFEATYPRTAKTVAAMQASSEGIVSLSMGNGLRKITYPNGDALIVQDTVDVCAGGPGSGRYPKGSTIAKGIAALPTREHSIQKTDDGGIDLKYTHRSGVGSGPKALGHSFGQDIEPAGRYLNEQPDRADYQPATGEQTGTVHFKNPLVVDFGGGYSEPSNWKQVVSKEFGGKKGKVLSKAIAKAGYDGIITTDKYGTAEIVDLTSISANSYDEVRGMNHLHAGGPGSGPRPGQPHPHKGHPENKYPITPEIATAIEKAKPAYAKMQHFLSQFTELGETASRLKTAESLAEKVQGRGKPLSDIADIVGARITTHNLSQVYAAVDKIKADAAQQGIKLLEVDDKIENPNDSGYRGIHLTLDIDGTPTELQIRTKNQSSWAGWAHDLVYKGALGKVQVAADYARHVADTLFHIDSGKKAAFPVCPAVVAAVAACYHAGAHLMASARGLVGAGTLKAPAGRYRVVGVDTMEAYNADFVVGDYKNLDDATRVASQIAQKYLPVYIYDDQGKLLNSFSIQAGGPGSGPRAGESHPHVGALRSKLNEARAKWHEKAKGNNGQARWTTEHVERFKAGDHDIEIKIGRPRTSHSMRNMYSSGPETFKKDGERISYTALETALRSIQAAYSPDEARDKDGKWIDGPGGESAPKPASKAHTARVKKTVAVNQFYQFFHGTTSEALADIEKNGLKPGGSAGGDTWLQKNFERLHPGSGGIPEGVLQVMRDRLPSVFMTQDEAIAQDYAHKAVEVHPGAHPILLQLKLPKSWAEKNLVSDELDYRAVRFPGVVPPKYINSYADLTDASLKVMPFPHATHAAAAAEPTQTYYALVLVTGAHDLQAGGPGSGRYPKGSTDNGLGRQGEGRVFVSPNVKEGTTLEDAKQGLNSDRQKNFEKKLHEIASAVLGQHEVRPALGVWADGAENSTELHTSSTDRERRRYAAALAGKAAEQKAVLDWENGKNGPHTLHRITARGVDGDTLNSKLGEAGIEFRTVEASPEGKSSRAYVLDQDGALGDKIAQFAKANGYGHEHAQGTGDFIGSWNTREEGRQEYDKIIQAYEAKHAARRFTGQLAFGAGVARTALRRGGDGDRVHRSPGHDPAQGPQGPQGVAGARPVPADVVLAQAMVPGRYRVVGGEDKAVVVSLLPLAKTTAQRRATQQHLVQVYDHLGTVIYATGAGIVAPRD